MPQASEPSADSCYLKALAAALEEIERTVGELHDLVLRAFAGDGQARAELERLSDDSNRQLG